MASSGREGQAQVGGGRKALDLKWHHFWITLNISKISIAEKETVFKAESWLIVF